MRETAPELPAHGCGSTRRRRHAPPVGFTLLELMLTVAVVGLLISLALGQYADYRERVLVGEAVSQIRAMSLEITTFQMENGGPPVSLDTIGAQSTRDPWGNPYQYTPLIGPGHGEARKDRRLNPLNSDFDLFSMGKNGTFKPQISHQESLDDVIRASDGAFVDLASKY